jgi:hypothetical protein
VGIIPVGTLSDYLLVPNRIMSPIKLNLKMTLVESEHLISRLWLQLGELVDLIMVMLFGQLDSQIRAIILRIHVQAALARNLLAKTVQFIRTVGYVVTVVGKLNNERLV